MKIIQNYENSKLQSAQKSSKILKNYENYYFFILLFNNILLF